MPWSNTVTDVGSMGDRKYAYGTAHHSGHVAGNLTIPMYRVDSIYFTQIQSSGVVSKPLLVGNGIPPWGTPATPWQTTLAVTTDIAGVVGASGVFNVAWWAYGKGG